MQWSITHLSPPKHNHPSTGNGTKGPFLPAEVRDIVRVWGMGVHDLLLGTHLLDHQNPVDSSNATATQRAFVNLIGSQN